VICPQVKKNSFQRRLWFFPRTLSAHQHRQCGADEKVFEGIGTNFRKRVSLGVLKVWGQSATPFFKASGEILKLKSRKGAGMTKLKV